MLDWLNRIGILLNFLAGFMLAPELIGIQRLQRAESYFKKLLPQLENKLSGFIKTTQEDLGKPIIIAFSNVNNGRIAKGYTGGIVYGILHAIFALLFMIWGSYDYDNVLIEIFLILYLFWFGLVSVKVMQIDVRFQERMRGSIGDKFALWFGLTLTHIPTSFFRLFSVARLLGLLIGYYSGVYLTLLILRLLQALLNQAIDLLEGEEKVKGLVVAIGIMFFIIGNMLQLMATF